MSHSESLCSRGIRPQQIAQIHNNSSQNVWIKAGDKRYCLKPGETSRDIPVIDPDGILLDGRPYTYSGQDQPFTLTYHEGAIKVCDLGILRVRDGLLGAIDVSISETGYICPGDPAGYKTPEWCRQQSQGWAFATAPVGRSC